MSKQISEAKQGLTEKARHSCKEPRRIYCNERQSILATEGVPNLSTDRVCTRKNTKASFLRISQNDSHHSDMKF